MSANLFSEELYKFCIHITPLFITQKIKLKKNYEIEHTYVLRCSIVAVACFSVFINSAFMLTSDLSGCHRLFLTEHIIYKTDQMQNQLKLSDFYNSSFL